MLILFCFGEKKTWIRMKSWYCKTNKMENTWEKESFLSELQNKFTRAFLSLWCLHFKTEEKTDWPSYQFAASEAPLLQGWSCIGSRGKGWPWQPSRTPCKHRGSNSCKPAAAPTGKESLQSSCDQTGIPCGQQSCSECSTWLELPK